MVVGKMKACPCDKAYMLLGDNEIADKMQPRRIDAGGYAVRWVERGDQK